MGRVYAAIDGRLRRFIQTQPVFFVATAPSGDGGHINLSPKGMTGTFAVLDEHRVAYLDYYGSGVETIAHLRDNGRIVLMFCAFSGPPTIVRLHGTGRTIRPGDPGFDELLAAFGDADLHAVRSIIDVAVTRVADSCGYAVPLMDYVGDRDLLIRAHERRTAAQLADYGANKNAASIDGLPALAGAPPDGGRSARSTAPTTG
jgi:hypothetical protein